MYNAQSLLENMGILINQEIPLPYGLSLELDTADGIEDLCDTQNELNALRGLMGVCQGVVLTLREVKIPLLHMILVANERLGLIVSIKQSDTLQYIIDKLGLSSVQELLDMALCEIIDQIDSVLPGITVQYMEFAEMEILWYKIVNSKMLYILKNEYQSTNYSMLNGLDRLIQMI